MKPFVTDFNDLLIRLSIDLNNNKIGLYISFPHVNSIFDKLLIQEVKREINGKNISFVCIRTIELKPDFKGKGLFKSFITELQKKRIPIMFQDVVNHNLHKSLIDNDYIEFNEVKNNLKMVSLYKIN